MKDRHGYSPLRIDLIPIVASILLAICMFIFGFISPYPVSTYDQNRIIGILAPSSITLFGFIAAFSIFFINRQENRMARIRNEINCLEFQSPQIKIEAQMLLFGKTILKVVPDKDLRKVLHNNLQKIKREKIKSNVFLKLYFDEVGLQLQLSRIRFLMILLGVTSVMSVFFLLSNTMNFDDYIFITEEMRFINSINNGLFYSIITIMTLAIVHITLFIYSLMSKLSIESLESNLLDRMIETLPEGVRKEDIDLYMEKLEKQ